MTAGYLGMPPRTVAATVAAALGVAAIVHAVAPIPAPAPCGYVAEVEDGVATILPAACASEAELGAMLDAIRAERSGGRW